MRAGHNPHQVKRIQDEITAMKQLLVFAMLVFAAASFSAIANAGPAGASSAYQFCHYYKQKAMWTGDQYWWARWRHCLTDWGD